MKWWFIFVVALICCSSCANKKLLNLQNDLKYRRNACFYYIDSFQGEPTTFQVIPKEQLTKSGEFSWSEMHILSILNVEQELAQLTESPSGEELNKLRLSIYYKFQALTMEVSGTAAMLDCEEERTEQVSDYLADLQAKREQKLTVGSIITGGAVGLGSVLLLTSDRDGRWIDILGIIGGVTEVILGVSILKTDFRVDIQHPINPLREIYTGERETTFFSDEVWWFLNNHRLDQQSPTVAESLREEWIQFYGLESGSVFFQDGGKYNADELKLRADLIDQLEARVLLMQQSISKLMFKLGKNLSLD